MPSIVIVGKETTLEHTEDVGVMVTTVNDVKL